MSIGSNLFLENLLERDRLLFYADLRLVNLARPGRLPTTDNTHVFFPLDAVISIVVDGKPGEPFETAIVGRDGCFGAGTALGVGIAPHRGLIKSGGAALVIESRRLRSAALNSCSLLLSLLRHEQILLRQVQYNCACSALHTVQQRFARQLLWMHDLTGRDVIRLRHGDAASRMGVRRTTVTEAAVRLSSTGTIAYSRGRIEILSPVNLRTEACGCYNVVRGLYGELLDRGGELDSS